MTETVLFAKTDSDGMYYAVRGTDYRIDGKIYRFNDWEELLMLVLAHRGASAYAPENTEPAFRKAIELGATAWNWMSISARMGTWW